MSWSAQALDTRMALARSAQRSLDLQYYVIHDDEVGRHLLRTVREAALRGVRVRLLLDDLYTAGMDPLLLGLAATPNIELRLFNPFPAARGSLLGRFTASLFDIGRVNHRMHNKLFIADGAMAIAGGRNIGNEYFMVHNGANYIDLDAFVAGATVPRLASLFDQYWNSEFVYPLAAVVRNDEDPELLQRRFVELTSAQRAPEPKPAPQGAKDLLGYVSIAEEMRSAGKIALVLASAEAFADAPEKVINHKRSPLPGAAEEAPTVRSGLMNELLLARKEVLVSSPYLVPDRFVMEDIREARLWGVPITIITNSLASTDEPIVHAGYQRYRHELVDLGVQLYEVAPSRVARHQKLGAFGQSIGRFHAKAAAIDRQVIFVGSLNFDPRSAKHNTELGLLIRSPKLAEELLMLAELVKTEAAFRVRLSADKSHLQWHSTLEDRQQTLDEEPDTSIWQRGFLWLIGPFVPEALL